ncbi:hypothetical protein BYT27DRAFT_7189062 [Phlegmacium glaucopus]|nr:hypothetical protein BYT27DRAFT_7189062 [Phlegmacium glaucopus]
MGEPRFIIKRDDFDMYIISDRVQGFEAHIHIARLRWDTFSIGRWFAERCATHNGYPNPCSHSHHWLSYRDWADTKMGDTLERHAEAILHLGAPYPNEPDCSQSTETRFSVSYRLPDMNQFIVTDKYRGCTFELLRISLETPEFNLHEWYCRQLAEIGVAAPATESATEPQWPFLLPSISEGTNDLDEESMINFKLGGIQVDRNKYPSLQRNAAQVKGKHRILPKPIVVKVTIDGHPAWALLDSGSLGDFMSSTLADQLSVKKEKLDVPLPLQLAVQGSRSKVNAVTSVQFQYQGINEQQTFDIININNYDLILGTPWMHQHQVCLGFNPARVVIGSNESQPLQAGPKTRLMIHALTPEEQDEEKVREELLPMLLIPKPRMNPPEL